MVFLSCSMMIKAKNIIMKERIWINRVTQRDHNFQYLHRDTVPLHDERVITVREEPSLHVESYRRDVSIVKRSGEWFGIWCREILVKLTLGGLIPADC